LGSPKFKGVTSSLSNEVLLSVSKSLNTLFFGGEEHCSSHGRRAKRAKEFPKG
jgi:hypothetical protein